MAFNNQYTSQGPSLLYFFGYELVEKESTYMKRYTVKDSDSITGTTHVYGEKAYKEKLWVRSKTPTGKELELENKFISEVEKDERFITKGHFNDYFDPTTAPCPPKYLSKVYERECLKNAPRSNLMKIVTAIGIALIVLWFALYSVIFPTLEQALGYDFAMQIFVMIVPIVLAILIIIMRKIVDNIESKKFSKYWDELPDLFELPLEERERIKKEYYDEIKLLYGEKAGNILIEYVKFKGYDYR